MQLNELKKILQNLKMKGFQEGLTAKDYSTLVYLFSQSYKRKEKNQDWTNFNKELLKLKYQFYKSGLLSRFSPSNCEYIVNHSSLLALVLANNTVPMIKMEGLCNYLFFCQFHSGNHPKMKIAEEKQTMYCYSCKISYNVISYLENYEHLSFKETINLLAQIFLFPLPYYNADLEELAKKYQESLLSQEYETLIQNGYQRILEKSDDTLENPLEHANAFLTFRQELISRVKNQEFDKDFVYEDPSKRFFLK